jgi:hypothetical protein
MKEGETRRRLALNCLVPGTGLEPARLAALDPSPARLSFSKLPVHQLCTPLNFFGRTLYEIDEKLVAFECLFLCPPPQRGAWSAES